MENPKAKTERRETVVVNFGVALRRPILVGSESQVSLVALAFEFRLRVLYDGRWPTVHGALTINDVTALNATNSTPAANTINPLDLGLVFSVVDSSSAHGM
jgi:hypothetical protein